ncbi:MAG: IS66 family insertion sequence element accessory protein TnpB [Bacteroidetes bacterium]|nr:IS66 family insertion sequence element accessory protein TnpB [Bacteroidota bacterium]
MILSFSDRYRYFVYAGSCDMRKGYDCLNGLVRNEFKKDPLLGDVFIFLSRGRNKIKLLHWQGDGFCIFPSDWRKGLLKFQSRVHPKMPWKYLRINFNLFLKELYFLLLKKSAL